MTVDKGTGFVLIVEVLVVNICCFLFVFIQCLPNQRICLKLYWKPTTTVFMPAFIIEKQIIFHEIKGYKMDNTYLRVCIRFRTLFPHESVYQTDFWRLYTRRNNRPTKEAFPNSTLLKKNISEQNLFAKLFIYKYLYIFYF